MMNGQRSRRFGGVAAALVGVLFFFIIVGVFGVRFAIAGLVVFIIGAVVVYRAFPAEGAEL
jgi:cell shape-determining protein MreD